MTTESSSILLIGSGLAGLTCAIKFAEADPTLKITIVAKTSIDEGATRYAQGGIASVWSKEDSFEEHIQDTLVAGAGLCNPKVVEICVQEGPARVRELVNWGVPFTKSQGDPTEEFDLHREGGHGKRRILHADDLTGLAIEKTLVARVRSHPQIRVLEHHTAIDLITDGKLQKNKSNPGRCRGAYILDEQTGKISVQSADLTILATGGAGKVYLYTSNPDTATGDGIAMAHRAGAEVSHLEFIQFHPTCLYHPTAKTFLISEALRGEGAVLKTIDGQEFMHRYHPMGSLAPRDIVARAIDSEMKRLGDPHVFLHLLPALTPQDIRSKFPNIYEFCLKYGIDITRTPIPVVPAAHYTCGGVSTDEFARTSLAGLYAVGEVACTGLHGANRLASNSLLEAVVFAHRAVQAGLEDIKHLRSGNTPLLERERLPEWDSGHAVELEERIDIAAHWFEIRWILWNYVGIVRSNRRLERAERRLKNLKSEIDQNYWNYLLSRELIELRNLITVAQLIVQAAQDRKENRGLHYNVDHDPAMPAQ